MNPLEDAERKRDELLNRLITDRMEFENRALKLIMMRLADAGVSPILTDNKRCHFGFDPRVTMIYSEDSTVNDALERAIVDAAATMLPDCVGRPFPFLPQRLCKPWMDNARTKPLDSNIVDVWIADLAVEAIQRRAEKLANGDLP